ncbi:relaxase/mobilization nuclease domain-containing protein [Kineococcus sp. SYSU DK004]|uniref:relaxase/mobilization nuclease domain-containing protein n=1 Tax=Kineococcus sp. SYSU DK004 TaxID=3383125 RepID=UPI003D7C677D
MIGKVSRGNDTAGLLRYLFGPGRANEHTDPHLVATWDGDDPQALAGWQPTHDGRRHDVRALTAVLEQPLAALLRQPSKTVWHASLRAAPDDRRLSDEEWAEAARHALDRVGLAPAGDDGACRWVAVRHAEDHVHLLVTLARQDGKSARTSHDYRRLGQACRDLEERYGLHRTPARDGTATRRPTRAESEKARRLGRGESSRETLRREVRLAALASDGPESFVADLRSRGLLVKLRHSSQDPTRVSGYAVAWPGDHDGDGRPIWFSGSRLAGDLSMSNPLVSWRGASDGTSRVTPARRRSQATRAAGVQGVESSWRVAVRSLDVAQARVDTSTVSSHELAAVARAAADVLLSAARVLEGVRGGPLTTAADAWDRACGRGRPRTRSDGLVAASLERAARVVALSDRSLAPEAAVVVVRACELLVAVVRRGGRGGGPHEPLRRSSVPTPPFAHTIDHRKPTRAPGAPPR